MKKSVVWLSAVLTSVLLSAGSQALAQANLDGGGNTDEKRRAKTPLPASPRAPECIGQVGRIPAHGDAHHR